MERKLSDLATAILGVVTSFLAAGVMWYLITDEEFRKLCEKGKVRRR
jgi:hypothetical protein